MLRRAGAFAFGCAVTLAWTAPAVAATEKPGAANANFIGSWTPTPGIPWTILTQNAAGACTGVSADSSFTMTKCKVTGDAYTFTLDDAPIEYTSRNAGTINGVSLTGSFHDSSGTTEEYTATRAPLTTTRAVCTAQTTPMGTFTCAVTVTAQSSANGAPTGDVSLTLATGGLNATSCALVAASATSASCSVVLTPTIAGNERREVLRALYGPSGPFGGSEGAATIDAVTVVTTAAPVATYLEGSSEAIFTFTLSRPSDHDTLLRYSTRDGSGKNAAVAAVGDYQRTNGMLTVPPGTTTTKFDVKCLADVHLRADGDFDLVVTAASGAALGAAASSKGAVTSRAEPPSATVKETIDPHLRVGDVGVIRNLTTGGAGKLYVRRYGSRKVIALHEGDALFVGDELFTDPNSAAAAIFVLGGAAAVQPGGHVQIVDERHTYTEPTGNFVYLRQLIKVISNVSHQKETIQIQTNGGIIGIKD